MAGRRGTAFAGVVAGAAEGPGPPIAFGPVRSRRLGWSLGINNVPPKTCWYSCVYCQVGPTDRASLERQAFLRPRQHRGCCPRAPGRSAGRSASRSTTRRSSRTASRPSTALLGDAIRGVAALGRPVAILTNGSLLWHEDVRAALAAADWVSIRRSTRSMRRPGGAWTVGREPPARYGPRGHAPVRRRVLRRARDRDDARRGAQRRRGGTPAHGGLRQCPRPAASVHRDPHPPASHAMRSGLRRRRWPAGRPTCSERRTSRPPASSKRARSRSRPPTTPRNGSLGIVAVHPMTEQSARDYLVRSGADWTVAERFSTAGGSSPSSMECRASCEERSGAHHDEDGHDERPGRHAFSEPHRSRRTCRPGVGEVPREG